MREIFQRWFYLRDHPFAPDDGRDVSPEKPLNLFTADETARPYFTRLEAFDTAISRLENFFLEKLRAIQRGKPPTLLILGPAGSGRTTLAGYAAHFLRKQCTEEGLPAPNFADVDVASEDFGRLLEDIRPVVLEHLADHGVAWQTTVDAAGPLSPDSPNQAQLERLYKNLGRRAPETMALNVIAIGPITARREKWMLDLRMLLAPLRVLPIFYTGDPTVASTFDASADQSPRLSVVIRELRPEDAISLLRARFELLQTADRAQRGVDALFPYSDVLVRLLIPERQKADIKYFISVCSAAFDAKVTKIRKHNSDQGFQPPDAVLTWEDFQNAIRESGLRR